MNPFQQRRYIVIDTADLESVTFKDVMEELKTVRKSKDGTKAIIEYNLPTPQSIIDISKKNKEYNYPEIINLLSAEEWSLAAVGFV